MMIYGLVVTQGILRVGVGVTGEAWSFERWDTGAPNNVTGNEDHLNIVRSSKAGEQ